MKKQLNSSSAQKFGGCFLQNSRTIKKKKEVRVPGSRKLNIKFHFEKEFQMRLLAIYRATGKSNKGSSR